MFDLAPKGAAPDWTGIPAFWPMAMAAAMVKEGTALYARNIEFVDEEIKIHEALLPKLATANRPRLDAGDGPIKRMVHETPLSFYRELVELGGPYRPVHGSPHAHGPLADDRPMDRVAIGGSSIGGCVRLARERNDFGRPE
jgi:hypothetical protein